MLRRSFTLVELLAALALTGLVVTLTGRITMHLVQVRGKVTQVVDRLEREALVFETLERDIRGLVFGLPGSEISVKVFGTPRQTLELIALAASAQSESLHLALYPATIRYRLLAESGTDGPMKLIRETSDRTSPYMNRETLSTDLQEFTIQVRVKNHWATEFPSPNRSLAAEAIRIQCRWSGQPIVRTFVLGKS